MEVHAQAATGAASPVSLARLESHLAAAHEGLGATSTALRYGSLLLGEAPVELVSPLLRLTVPESAGRGREHVPLQAGLAIDGIVRGLVFSGGLLRAPVERAVPWLFATRTTAPWASSALGVARSARTFVRIGTLGLTAALGGARALRAVSREGGDWSAIATTRDGRGGALQAVGGVLQMLPNPVAKIAGSVLLLGAMANDLAAFGSSDVR